MERKFTPRYIHIGYGTGNICGVQDRGSWRDKWMASELAASLPTCPRCLETITNPPVTSQPVVETVEVLSIESESDEKFLIDYNQS